MNNYEEFKELKIKLDELRIDILTLTNSEDGNQDLQEHFYRVRDTSPEIYELLVLIYNEFQMKNKSDRKQFLILLDKALNIKYVTVNKLMKQNKYSKSIKNRLLEAVTYTNIKRTLFMTALVFLFIFGIYEIDDKAFNAMSNTTQQILEKIID